MYFCNLKTNTNQKRLKKIQHFLFLVRVQSSTFGFCQFCEDLIDKSRWDVTHCFEFFTKKYAGCNEIIAVKKSLFTKYTVFSVFRFQQNNSKLFIENFPSSRTASGVIANLFL